MLEELRIENFAIIDRVTLDFTRGFNVITGETGAGKSIIIDAVELLLGGKADSGTVRAGADKAIIEATFLLDEHSRTRLMPLLEEEALIEPGETLDYVTLSREVRAAGRSSARINGVTVNQDLLRDVGESLVNIHGQSAHLTLFKPRAHMNLLDRYASLLEVRSALAKVVDSLNTIRREIRSLEEDKAELERRADRLRYEVEEITTAALESDEEADLLSERNRLANAEQLATLAGNATVLLSGDDSGDTPGAVDLLQQLGVLMNRLVKIDPDLTEEFNLAEELSASAQELALTLAGYTDDMEFDPVRLDEVEERLELIKSLKRRYKCETIEQINAYAEKAAQELDNIEHSEERIEQLRTSEEKTLRHIGELCQRINSVRKIAGGKLGERVVRELKDLRMENTQFEVVLTQVEDPSGCYVDDKRYKFDASGMDDVEFMMSANPGEPLRPLSKVASGGESARIMLAIKRVLSQADETPTLIFDEIDQGIGGRVGAVVGEKLWSLSSAHQVMVVTHLPQLASFGDAHFNVRKQIKGERTLTHVITLENDDERIEELAAMLGAAGEAGKQSALDLLQSARERKQNIRPVEPA